MENAALFFLYSILAFLVDLLSPSFIVLSSSFFLLTRRVFTASYGFMFSTLLLVLYNTALIRMNIKIKVENFNKNFWFRLKTLSCLGTNIVLSFLSGLFFLSTLLRITNPQGFLFFTSTGSFCTVLSAPCAALHFLVLSRIAACVFRILFFLLSWAKFNLLLA